MIFRDAWYGLIAGIFICIFWFASFVIAFPRDLDGKYAAENPALHAWFNKLASGKGLCCSFADGVSVQDVDWDTRGDNYRVRVCVGGPAAGETWTNCANKDWITVPDAALVTEPNKFGPAVVWPYVDKSGVTQIRCFIPGSGA